MAGGLDNLNDELRNRAKLESTGKYTSDTDSTTRGFQSLQLFNKSRGVLEDWLSSQDPGPQRKVLSGIKKRQAHNINGKLDDADLETIEMFLLFDRVGVLPETPLIRLRHISTPTPLSELEYVTDDYHTIFDKLNFGQKAKVIRIVDDLLLTPEVENHVKEMLNAIVKEAKKA